MNARIYGSPDPRPVHDFQRSLEVSKTYVNAPWWEAVYRQAFPTLQSMQSVNEAGWAQSAGIDRLLILKGGKVLQVDEKVRPKDWGDVLLEYWSDQEHKRPGWIAKDLACDYIAYAYVETQRCLLLPFPTLRVAWDRYRADWVRDYKRIEARNNGYTTISVAVPQDVLFTALRDCMIIQW